MREFGVYDIFVKNSRSFPHKPALVWKADALSFLELKETVDRLASGLYRHGVSEGERVALVGQNCDTYVQIFGAAARLGAIVVPVNWRLSDDEVAYVLKDASPRVVIYDADHMERTRRIVKSALPGCRCFSMNCPEGAPDPAIHTVSGGEAPLARITADTPLCLIYTAAMGGSPRGAILSHGNIVASNLQTMATMALGARDACLNLLPLFHITGLNLCFAAMHAGAKNVVMPKFDADEALRLCEKENITLLGSFPPILANLDKAIEKDGPVPKTLRCILGIDAPDTISRFQGKTGAVFWILYGQTETSGLVTFSPALEKPGSAGRQGLLVHVGVVDPEDRPLPTGEVGEIVVRGPLVFHGFWNREEESREIFRNRWHHTGDLGAMDKDGYLWFKGRKPEKELIKPGGENVYPAEVEKVILEHPAVKEVSVIGVPDPKFGEGIKAVCVLSPGADLTAEALITFVGERIARYKKPRYVTFTEKLPKKTDGTIDRDRVKAEHGKGD